MPAIFPGSYMLYRLTIRSADSCVGDKRLKAMTYAIKALYKNDNRFFYNRIKVLENTMAVLAKATFNNLQALQTRINWQDDDLAILDKNLWHFGRDKLKPVKSNSDINNHHLVIQMLTKVFKIYTKVLRKYIWLYDTYIRAVNDFRLALGTLSNERLKHQIIG